MSLEIYVKAATVFKFPFFLVENQEFYSCFSFLIMFP